MLTESARPLPAQTADIEAPKRRLRPLPDWLALAALLLVSLKLVIKASGPIDDPDTWWHLRLGEEFRGAWSLGHPGQLSPFATRPWFATQWTLEVVASYINDTFGLAGVAWLAGVGVVALFVALYLTCRQRGSIAPAALAAAFALMATSLSDGPRPQVASFILVAVFTAGWLRSVDDLRPRWWLIPLSWLWACTHGMWFIGVLIGVVVGGGLLLDRRLDRRTGLLLGAVPVGGLIAATLTPVGPKLILAPFFTSKTAGFIQEWQPPNFQELVPALALAMVALVVIVWARGGLRRSFTEIFLLSMAVGWIVLSYRTVAVGAVIAAPLVAGAIQTLRPPEPLRMRRWEAPMLVAAALAIVVGLGIAAPLRKPPRLEGLTGISTFLSRLPEETVVYNDYGLGGWLEWKHRNVAPVIDGMTDAYRVKYVRSYVEALHVQPGWRQFVEQTGAEYALLEQHTPLAAALLDSKDWRTVVRDSKYVLLRRAADQTDTP